MEKYFKPKLRVFSASDLVEVIGPVQMASMNVYGGATTAQLNTKHPAEYRLAKAHVNYEIFTQKEAENA